MSAIRNNLAEINSIVNSEWDKHFAKLVREQERQMNSAKAEKARYECMANLCKHAIFR